MSNYHIKNITKDGRKASVVFHIPIPALNNSAGIPFRTALMQYKPVTVSDVPWLSSGELTQIQNGEIFEHSEVVSFLADDSNAQKQGRVDAIFTDLNIIVLNEIKARLKFWGLDRDVV